MVWLIVFFLFIPVLLFIVLPLFIISSLKSNKNSEQSMGQADWDNLSRLEAQRKKIASRIMTLQLIISKDFPDVRFNLMTEAEMQQPQSVHADLIYQLEALSNSIKKLDNHIFQLEMFLDGNMKNWRKRL